MPADLVAATSSAGGEVEQAFARASLETVQSWIRQWCHLDEEAASNLATALTSTPRWGLPGRSLRPSQLRELGLPFQLSSQSPELDDALAHYDALLQISLSSNLYKIFETVNSQIFRALPASLPVQLPVSSQAPTAQGREESALTPVALFDVHCECGAVSKVQANLGRTSPLQDGYWAFPADNIFLCPECMRRKDLTELRHQVEAQTKQKMIT
jgi:hypothetical protein